MNPMYDLALDGYGPPLQRSPNPTSTPQFWLRLRRWTMQRYPKPSARWWSLLQLMPF